MTHYVFILLAILICVPIQACRWAVPSALLPKPLIIGVREGVDPQGHWHASVRFDWSRTIIGFRYDILSSTPPIHAPLGWSNGSKHETILKEYSTALTYNGTFQILIGVHSDCDMRADQVKAMYTVELKSLFHFEDYFLNNMSSARHSNGWAGSPQLVFHPDISHYSCVHITRWLGRKPAELNTTLKLLTDENNQCGTNGGCMAIADASLTMDPVVREAFVVPIRVSYAVSLFIQTGVSQDQHEQMPSDFNVSRRQPVIEAHAIRYDVCEAVECVHNCTGHRHKNDQLIADAGIHVLQTWNQTETLFQIQCRFEPFSFLDGFESPFVYVKAWFKLQAFEDDWTCPPYLGARLYASARHPRRLSFMNE